MASPSTPNCVDAAGWLTTHFHPRKDVSQRALCRHVDFDGTRRRLEPGRWLASAERSRFRLKTLRLNHLRRDTVVAILNECPAGMAEITLMACEGLDWSVLYMACFASAFGTRSGYEDYRALMLPSRCEVDPTCLPRDFGGPPRTLAPTRDHPDPSRAEPRQSRRVCPIIRPSPSLVHFRKHDTGQPRPVL